MALTDEQKLDRKVWKFIGYWTCCSIDKYLKTRLYYVKAGKSIRVEDFDCCLAYANIRQCNLDENDLGMTMAEFEQWLIAHGVNRQVQKRVKRSLPLYD